MRASTLVVGVTFGVAAVGAMARRATLNSRAILPSEIKRSVTQPRSTDTVAIRRPQQLPARPENITINRTPPLPVAAHQQTGGTLPQPRVKSQRAPRKLDRRSTVSDALESTPIMPPAEVKTPTAKSTNRRKPRKLNSKPLSQTEASPETAPSRKYKPYHPLPKNKFKLLTDAVELSKLIPIISIRRDSRGAWIIEFDTDHPDFQKVLSEKEKNFQKQLTDYLKKPKGLERPEEFSIGNLGMAQVFAADVTTFPDLKLTGLTRKGFRNPTGDDQIWKNPNYDHSL